MNHSVQHFCYSIFSFFLSNIVHVNKSTYNFIFLRPTPSKLYRLPYILQNAIHPYLASALDYITVNVPRAIEYTIQFDVLTMTELFQDIVTFCATPSCAKVYGSKSGYSGLSGSSWPGLGGTPQLVIDAPSFVVRFTSNGTF